MEMLILMKEFQVRMENGWAMDTVGKFQGNMSLSQQDKASTACVTGVK